MLAPEYVGNFLEAADRVKINYEATRCAAENITVIGRHSEQETVAFMAKFDVVFAVWFDADQRELLARKIKGPETMVDGMSFNAIPVANAGEADRWSELFAGETPPRLAIKPRLIAQDGALIE